MKDETLQKFREEFTTYAKAVDSDFSEIDELKKSWQKFKGINNCRYCWLKNMIGKGKKKLLKLHWEVMC